MLDDLVFLVDVDETLLNNDIVVEDLKQRLAEAYGDQGRRRYWELFEELFNDLGYADYLGALQRFRLEKLGDATVHDIALYFLHYPFEKRLYPGALETIAALNRLGRVVIVSDGDAVYQPNKVERSGIRQAANGHVLIYVNKAQSLDDVERRYPARRYVMVDDKLRILTPIKESWRERVTTVFVRQGHYALDPAIVAAHPAADVTIDRIEELRSFRRDQFD